MEIPDENNTDEESKCEDLKSKEKPLKILSSIKINNLSITDFDIDRNCYFVSLLTSEGEVLLYDIATLEKSDEDVTNQKVKNSSRDTISYHKSFKYVTELEFESDIKNYSAYIPEEGLISNDSVRMKDITTLDFNNSMKKSCIDQSKIGSAYKPHLEPPFKINYNNSSQKSNRRFDFEESKLALNEQNLDGDSAQKLLSGGLSSRVPRSTNPDILIYKKGVPDIQDYGSFYTDFEKNPNQKKTIPSQKFTGKKISQSSTITIEGGEVSMAKLKSILKKFHEYPEKYRKAIWQSVLSLPLNKSSCEALMNKPHPAFKDLRK